MSAMTPQNRFASLPVDDGEPQGALVAPGAVETATAGSLPVLNGNAPPLVAQSLF